MNSLVNSVNPGDPLESSNATAIEMDSDLSTDVDDIYSLIKQDLTAVNQLIQKRLRSDVALINQMGGYIINSGGKRLRPVISLLSARAMGYEGAQHIHLDRKSVV